MSDHAFMRRALRLAVAGLGRVSPNPMVGAVLVKDGRIVGEGAHLRLGQAHAEVHALQEAGAKARGATLYVTLEPCSHHGRTPPCADAVVAAGVGRVVCAQQDPDPRVKGRGLERLRQAGIAVQTGLLEAEARCLNAAYLKHRSTGLPWTLLKLAQSLDGRIATRSGDARWITGPRARAYGHRWRSRVDAVLVGANTVLADDPRLDVRHVRGPDPRPVVLDGRLRTRADAQVFGRPGCILATAAHPQERLQPFADRGVEVWTFPDEDGRLRLRQVFQHAAAAGIAALLVEGGGQVAAAALNERLVDRLMAFVAPRLLGEGIAAVGDLGILEVKEAVGLDGVRVRQLGPDLLYQAEVRYPCSPD